MYHLVFKKSVLKDIRQFPQAVIKKIQTITTSLTLDPRPLQSKNLSNSDAYRFRFGRYRVLYVIDDRKKIITIVKIAHRRDVYR